MAASENPTAETPTQRAAAAALARSLWGGGLLGVALLAALAGGYVIGYRDGRFGDQWRRMAATDATDVIVIASQKSLPHEAVFTWTSAGVTATYRNPDDAHYVMRYFYHEVLPKTGFGWRAPPRPERLAEPPRPVPAGDDHE